MLTPNKSILACDPEFIPILKKFVDDLVGRFATLREATENEQWEKLSLLAHQLKGTAGSYGLVELASLAEQIEDQIKLNCQKTRILELIQDMENSV